MSINTCTVHHNTVRIVFFTELNAGNDLGGMFISIILSTS